MSQITNQVSVAAGATEENVLNGSPFEFLSTPSAVSVAAVTDGALGEVTAKFSIGSRIISERFFPKAGKAALGVIADQDILISDVGNSGERLTLALTNGGLGAVNVEYLVSIQPL